jgi:hypothetical protein
MLVLLRCSLAAARSSRRLNSGVTRKLMDTVFSCGILMSSVWKTAIHGVTRMAGSPQEIRALNVRRASLRVASHARALLGGHAPQHASVQRVFIGGPAPTSDHPRRRSACTFAGASGTFDLPGDSWLGCAGPARQQRASSINDSDTAPTLSGPSTLSGPGPCAPVNSTPAMRLLMCSP